MLKDKTQTMGENVTRAIDLLEGIMVLLAINPEVFKAGDEWCVALREDGVQPARTYAFGDTPTEAIINLKNCLASSPEPEEMIGAEKTDIMEIPKKTPYEDLAKMSKHKQIFVLVNEFGWGYNSAYDYVRKLAQELREPPKDKIESLDRIARVLTSRSREFLDVSSDYKTGYQAGLQLALSYINEERRTEPVKQL